MQSIRLIGSHQWVLFVVLPVFACWLFHTQDHQAAHWRGAYFSMAANLTSDGRFLVDTTEINLFDQLPADQQATYRFHRSLTHQPTEYVFMQIGYGYICALARRVWPWGGDGQAVTMLQVAVHTGLCVWLLWLLPAGWRRWAFLLGYACNPFIIRYVTYDFYYFWQVIPSFLLVGTYLNGRMPWQNGLWLGLLIGLLFVVRPAMMGTFVALGSLWAYQRQVRLLTVTTVLAVGVAAFLYRPVLSAPWRPVYVGVAAYQNPYMNTLSDRAIYDLYMTKTGRPYRYGGSDRAQEERLTRVLQEEVKTLWQQAPLLFVGHALLNTLLAFSTGYVTGGGDGLNYLLAFVGLLVLGWLMWQRRYAHVLAVLATVATFSPYYPPIPAYVYGAYLLLVMAFVAPDRKKPVASSLR